MPPVETIVLVTLGSAAVANTLLGWYQQYIKPQVIELRRWLRGQGLFRFMFKDYAHLPNVRHRVDNALMRLGQLAVDCGCSKVQVCLLNNGEYASLPLQRLYTTYLGQTLEIIPHFTNGSCVGIDVVGKLRADNTCPEGSSSQGQARSRPEDGEMQALLQNAAAPVAFRFWMDFLLSEDESSHKQD